MFIFDVLPLAERWTVVETSRREEFVPLKNASGPDSPETVRQAQSDLAADWLERAGVAVPRKADGSAAVPLEISPLFALDAEELARKVDRRIDDTDRPAPSRISTGGNDATRDDHGRRRRHALLAAQPGGAAQAVPGAGRRAHAACKGARPHRGAGAAGAHLGHHRRPPTAREATGNSPACRPDHIVGEPFGRDTAACIGLGAP